MTILLDTGVFCAFLNKDDDHAEDAKAIITACMDGVHGAVLTTSDIVDETFTLLLARGAPASHIQAFSDLIGWDTEEIPLASVLEVDHSIQYAAWPLFERHYEDKGLSFTDCTTLHTMRRRGIDRLATFDDGFDGLIERVSGGS